MREAAAPGASYVFRVSDQGKTGRTLVLRFVRADADQGVFEAEIFDPATRQPFQEKTPLWKGKLGGGADAGIAFGTEGGKDSIWAFALVNDVPEIICPAAGRAGAVFPARNIPLFAAKIP